ncbi:LacI family DNA-binding transcriptional regulator [Nonomuraea sp. CA-143628]|uniref:LacI family DNA-binding transcriptional regulator n=1 Tax=Nonomuraea sp. CA-143628 TaxID=3239997 RepID=UPI003D93CEB9
MPSRAEGRAAGVTIADVAAHAGVSMSTVSYALSGKRRISGPTRERVMRAVADLGYHPHAGARSLASSQSNVIAVMVPLRTGMYVPVIMEILMAMTTAARTHGKDILLLTGDEGTDGVRRVAASGLADAAVLMDVELHDERIPVLREMSMPAVTVGLPSEPGDLASIDLDFEAAGGVCADHLADLGHDDVALIGLSAGVYHRRTGFAARTVSGFMNRARERGLRATHTPCDGTFDSAAHALTRILDERPATSGIVVQNEEAVGPLMNLLRQFGRGVPQDVSVVAICPDQVALQTSPRLTSVPIPAEEMGRGAIRLAMARLSGRPMAGATLIPPRLVVRGSSGARFTGGPAVGGALGGPSDLPV